MICRHLVTIDAGELLHLAGEPIVVSTSDVFGGMIRLDLNRLVLIAGQRLRRPKG